MKTAKPAASLAPRLFVALLIGMAASLAQAGPATGVVYAFTNFVGMPGGPGYGDGMGSHARFDWPMDVAVDLAGNVYVSDDYNHTIRKITPEGLVTTLAGCAEEQGAADGTGSAARFLTPYGLALDSAGNRLVKGTLLGDGGPVSGPTISLSTNSVVVRIGETSPILSATVSETDVASSNLYITALSSNTDLVSWKNVAFDSPSSDPRHFTITPVGPATGSTTLTLAVSHGMETNSAALNVLVLPSIHPVYGASDILHLNNGVPAFSSATLPELGGAFGKLTVSLFGLRDVDPASMSIGLLLPSHKWTLMPLYLKSGPSGPRSYADVTLDGGRSSVLAPWSAITNVVVASVADLNSLGAGSTLGQWSLWVTNGAYSSMSQIAAGWLMTFYMRPRIGPLTNTVALEGSSFRTYSWVADADGFVTNVSASLLGNPAMATITTTLSGTNLTMLITGNPGQIGTNRVQVVATDNDGLSSTNWFWVNFQSLSVPQVTVFTNSALITINDAARATPFPSTIQVSGVPAPVTKVEVTIKGLRHSYPSDIAMLLVGPQGQKVVLMRKAGDGVPISGTQLTFDDDAGAALPRWTSLLSGTYLPTDYDTNGGFYSPAPPRPYSPALATFKGTDPNGAWSLYVEDDVGAFSGAIEEGWTLSIHTEGAAPAISISPDRLDFGSVPVGATQYGYFYVTNTGGGTLSGDATVPPPFSIPWGAHYDLPPNAFTWQGIPIRYSPVVPGTNIAFVTFTGGGGATRIATGSAFLPVIPLTVTAPSGSGTSGSIISAPVVAGSFTNISLFQFSIHWNPAALLYRGVDLLDLPGLSGDSFGTNLAGQGTLMVSWDDPDGACETLPPSTPLFAVRFQLVGQPSTTNIVKIDGVPLAMEAADCGLQEVPIQAADGVVIEQVQTISGKVLAYGSGNPVPSTRLTLSGATNWTVYSWGDGSYAFYSGGRGSYCITPSRSTYSAANGVTTLDLALIRRHILGLLPLASPYKLLAADVNGSDTVSTMDIALVRRVILGETNAFPAGSWRFVPSDYKFPDPANPWNAPGSRCYTNLFTGAENQDFTAIKLGDVNDSWSFSKAAGAVANAAEPPPVSAPRLKESKAPVPAAIRFVIARGVALRGEAFKAGVGAGGFERTTSAQFTLEWDPAVLRYTGVGDFGLPGLSQANFGATLVSQGKLTFSWDDPGGLGVTLPDGSAAFTVEFEVAGDAGSASALRFCDSPTPREASTEFRLAGISTQDGEVTVLGAKPSVHIVPGPKGGALTFSVSTRSGLRYVLEFTDSLSHPNWTPLQSVAGDGAVKMLTDPGVDRGQGFYRVRIQQAWR